MASPVDSVALQARLNPERLAAVDLASELRWTYAALELDVARCATVLRERGCVAGDRVLAIAKNHVLQLILHLACARIGAIYTPLNVRLSGHELNELVSRAQPRLILGDARLERRVHEDLLLADLLAALPHAAPLPPEPIDPHRPSLMLFTSGTTGRPKGVMLSERNISETALNFSTLARVDRQSRFLGDAPMFHTIGLISNTRPALHAGGACLVSDGFDPAVTLARLADPKLRVSHYFCVPQMAAALRALPSYEPTKLAGLTALFTGGATHAADAVRTFVREGVAVADGYGMSELGCVFGMPLELSVIDQKAGSVGFSTARVQTRIVDEAGRPCPVGVPGELLVRGETVFAGYYESPDDTATAFVDDWFCTGDVVKVDEDGFHYVLDRKKDMFISGGENVYPAEIESCLLGFSDLAEAAVVGVPDARWGEVGHLVVVPVPGKTLDQARVLAFLNERLARYKVPRFVSSMTALPRTSTGKIQKHAIRSFLLANER